MEYQLITTRDTLRSARGCQPPVTYDQQQRAALSVRTRHCLRSGIADVVERCGVTIRGKENDIRSVTSPDEVRSLDQWSIIHATVEHLHRPFDECEAIAIDLLQHDGRGVDWIIAVVAGAAGSWL